MKSPLLSENIYEKFPESHLKELHLKKIFLTGGTGFFGKWLLDFFHWANEKKRIDVKVFVLTRRKKECEEKFNHYSNNIYFVEGDLLQDLKLENLKVDYCLHAGTSTDAKVINDNPITAFDTIIDGTRRVLEFAKRSQASRFLMVSSGAIYGRQSLKISHQIEDNSCSCDVTSKQFVYHESKRAAELLSSLYSSQHGLHVSMARCYAFCGPHLPLDKHFAVGNFIKDYLDDKSITIKGDGTSLRSYMYPSDLVLWLMTALLRGENNRAYNIGSEESLSILDLAKTVKIAGDEAFRELGLEPRSCDIQVLGKAKGVAPERYVPSTRRAREELKLTCYIKTKEAIKETIKWEWKQRKESSL